MRLFCLFAILFGIVTVILGHLQGDRRRRFSTGRGAVMLISETITREGDLPESLSRLLVNRNDTLEVIWEVIQ